MPTTAPTNAVPDHELLTPDEAARWFRRSPSWLRRQPGLLRCGEPGQPLYHLRACRAYYLGRLAGLDVETLRALQLRAVAAACGIAEDEALPELSSQARADAPLEQASLNSPATSHTTADSPGPLPAIPCTGGPGKPG